MSADSLSVEIQASEDVPPPLASKNQTDTKRLEPTSGDSRSVVRPMRGLLLLAALAAAFYFGPSVLEAADTPCDALVNRALAINPPRDADGQANRLATGLARVLGPVFVRHVAQTRYPHIPPQLACALIFWKSQADPESLRLLDPSAPTDAEEQILRRLKKPKLEEAAPDAPGQRS
jgi:hypothetical protein